MDDLNKEYEKKIKDCESIITNHQNKIEDLIKRIKTSELEVVEYQKEINKLKNENSN